MPAQESRGLDNQERLFPTANGPCKDEQEYAIRFATSWTFDLTTKDDQLLTEQRIFGDEFCPGASEIGEHPGEKGSTPGARPAQYTLLDPTE